MPELKLALPILKISIANTKSSEVFWLRGGGGKLERFHEKKSSKVETLELYAGGKIRSSEPGLILALPVLNLALPVLV